MANYRLRIGVTNLYSLLADAGLYTLSGQSTSLTHTFGDTESTTNQKYVRPGATGTGSGNDWTNAYTSIPTTKVRDTTYWLADGSYGVFPSMTTANNGTLRIRFKKATSAFHGTDIGWDPTYGDGVAAFTSNGASVTTGYWSVDGTVGGGPGAWESGHGITIAAGFDWKAFYVSGPAPHCSFKHLNIDNGGTADPGGGNPSGDTFYCLGGAFSDFTMEYCFLHDTNRTFFLTHPNPMSGTQNLIQYNKFARNGVVEHMEAYSGSSDSNMVFRYNLFEDITGTGQICLVNGGTETASGWRIYGNIFYWTDFWGANIATSPYVNNSGWLVVKFASPTFITASDWLIYNNIVAHIPGNNALSMPSQTGVVARNNIWTGGRTWQGGAIDCQTGGGSASNYGLFYDNDVNGTSGAQDVILGSNPFATTTPWLFADKNWGAANCPWIPSTAAVAQPGTSLSSPYNIDMFGTVRGSDGNFDRGAIEKV